MPFLLSVLSVSSVVTVFSAVHPSSSRKVAAFRGAFAL